jgi:hypothetical protein
MSNSIRLTGMVALLLGVLLAAALVEPEGARDLGLDPGNWTTLTKGAFGYQQTYYPPGPDNRALLQGIETKERVIEELLDGRLTLFEAAALFRHVDEQYPVRLQTPLSSEGLCWHVLQWVRVALRKLPEEERHEIIARFEDDLCCHKERNGKVILPDVAAAK